MNKPPIPTVTVRNTTLKRGEPKICVSITDRLQDDILDTCRTLIREHADLVEWRADYYRDYTNDFMIKDTLAELREILGDTPLIFTIRTVSEGGRAELKLWDFIKLYREAARTGMADILDIEYRIMLQLPRDVVADIRKYSKIIVSKHNFE